MGVLSIDRAQLEAVVEMHKQMDQGVTPADVWNKLASFGDSYAKSAAQVLEQPGSLGWNIVRGVWHAAGADFSKFNEVAKAHLLNYIYEIPQEMTDGRYSLPTSDIIENSYAAALRKFHISAYAAIDILIEKIKKNFHVSPPHWHSTPGIVELEPERVRPSDPAVFENIDAKKARDIWLQTGIHGVSNYISSSPAVMGGALGIQLAGWINGGKSFSISSAGGVSYYFNAETRNWAFFDGNGTGRASVDGELQKIDQSNWRRDGVSGQYELLGADGGWQTAGGDASALKMAAVDGRLYTWTTGGLSSPFRLAALDRANLLAAGMNTTDGPSPQMIVMQNSLRRVDGWSNALSDYPDTYVATDGQGHYLLVDSTGAMIGRVAVNGTWSVDMEMLDGRSVAVRGNGQYTVTQFHAITGMKGAMLHEADGTEIGIAPLQGAENVAYAVDMTVNFLNLVRAIQSGKPLPIVGAGVNTLAALNPASTVLSAGSSVLGAAGSLMSLQRNIKSGNVAGSLLASANLISHGASAYASALGYSATQSASAVSQAAAAGQYGAASGAVAGVGKAMPYVNLVYSLSQRNYTGAALAALSIAFPPAAPFLMVASIILGTSGEPDLPSAIGGYKWASDGRVAVDIRWAVGGGDQILVSYLEAYQQALEAMVKQVQEANPMAHLGLVANRLPRLQFSVHGCVITDIDPVTGQERMLSYNRAGESTNAAAGSPEFFRSLNEQFIYSALAVEAIAAQWEAETVRLQTLIHDPQAGLTELQRAQRNNQMAPAPERDAREQSWRPIMLDLNGDGIEVISRGAEDVYFDIDSTGFLKKTDWINRQDGLLVLDRNYNGHIDGGSELFSNVFVADAARGLASMRWVDANADGTINSADPVFEQLRVWQDANGNGTVDEGEALALEARGITSLNYSLGSFIHGGRSAQMSSHALLADAVGTQVQVTEGGIIVQSSNGEVSMIVTRTEDLSYLKPGKDHIKDGIEDIALDIIAADLLRNDTLGGAGSASLAMTRVDHARFGSVNLNNGVVRFTPDRDYSGSDAGFSYTVEDGAGRAGGGEVAISFREVNDAPVILSTGHDRTPIYGYRLTYSNGTDYDNNTNTNEVVMRKPIHSPTPNNPVPIDWIDTLRGKMTVVDPDDAQLSYTVNFPGRGVLEEAWPGSHRRGWGGSGGQAVQHYLASRQPRVFQTRFGFVTIENDGTWHYEPRNAAFLSANDAFELIVTDSHGASATTMVVVKMPPWEPPRYFENPIVLDLDRNGIVLQSLQQSDAFYDIKDDGWRYRMGWITEGDGLLAFDANGDGKITGRGELNFKDYMPGAQTDLEGLAAFDGNADGVISASDAIWARLLVWRDDNGDGVSDDGELSSVDEAGIQAISLESDRKFAESNGNIIHGMAAVTMTDGSIMQAADAAFERSNEVLFTNAEGIREIHVREAFAAPSEIHGSSEDDHLLGTTGGNHIAAGDGNDLVIDDQGCDVIEGGAGDDVLYSGADDDVVLGNDGNDTVFAGNGNDMLWGGEGVDLLLGEAGNDIVFAGEGDDLAYGGDGNDVLSGDGGDDILVGGSGVDALFGGSGDDLLSGGDGGDQLQGDDGNDHLDGGVGADAMTGGKGDDVYVIDDRDDTVIEAAGEGVDTVRTALDAYVLGEQVENLLLVEDPGALRATGNALDNRMTGNAENNVLLGLGGADHLIGGEGNDRLFGGGGDDVLDGGSGADNMTGGTGNDVYMVDHPDDVVLEKIGEGIDTVRVGFNYRLGRHLENLTFVSEASESDVFLYGYGNKRGNTIIGSDNAWNALYGEGGRDTLVGGAGLDRLYGGDGNDILDGGGGHDWLIGGNGNDTYLFRSGSGRDRVDVFRDGNNTAGRRNHDIVRFADIESTGLNRLRREGADLHVDYGDADSILFKGYFGADNAKPAQFSFSDDVDWTPDQLFAHYGLGLTQSDDKISLANEQALTVRASWGNDTVRAGSGNTFLQGDAGNDTLYGGAGNDLLFGGDGDDALEYSGGNNLLIGGRGNDTMTTSWERDIIAFNRGDGQDVVYLIKGGEKTLSLGGGIAYADLKFKKQDTDLMLLAGQDDQIIFRDWYDTWYPTTVSHDLSVLQLLQEGSSAVDGEAGDSIDNSTVQQFDFNKLVHAFDAARMSGPAMESWSLSMGPQGPHLMSSDTSAIGGDLALAYARSGNLSGISNSAAHALLASPGFSRVQQFSASHSMGAMM